MKRIQVTVIATVSAGMDDDVTVQKAKEILGTRILEAEQKLNWGFNRWHIEAPHFEEEIEAAFAPKEVAHV